MAKPSVVEGIKGILKDITGFPLVELNMSLCDDMALNEVDMIQLIEDIENDFGVVISEGDEDNWMTVQDIVEYVSKI